MNDLLNVYKWIQNRTKSNIFIWGHSLGTSISSHAVLRIQNLGLERPLGLILESPFNNMKEEISEFPLAQIFRNLPWFENTIVNPMAENFPFATDKYICGIDIPVMILHAKDDKVVPYKLGYKVVSLLSIFYHPLLHFHIWCYCSYINLRKSADLILREALYFIHLMRSIILAINLYAKQKTYQIKFGNNILCININIYL